MNEEKSTKSKSRVFSHASTLRNWRNSNSKSHDKQNNKSPSSKVIVQGNYNRVKISSSMLKLSSIYGVNNKWVKLTIITIVSILSGIIGDLLLQNTGLYTVGIEAIAQGIARIASYFSTMDKNVIMNALFWSLIIVVNIPLLIFGWFKVGKTFTIYSSYYVVVSSLFGLAFGFIHGIHDVFIFADTNLSSNNTPGNFLSDAGVQITLWNYDTTAQLSLFVYGIVYGVIQAIFYAILFILGCSSAGLDMIIVWYAEKKYKDIGTVFTYFNILCFMFSYVIGTYVPASLSIKEHLSPSEYHTAPWEVSLFFSPNFVSTLVMSVVLGITLNKFFPKYQMCKIEILSKKVDEIRNEIIDCQKPYSLSIFTVEGGYSKLPQKSLVTNCMYMDAPNLLKIVRKQDPNALFILTIIKNIDGYMYIAAKEEENVNIKLSFLDHFKFLKKKNKNDVKITFEIDSDNNLDLNNDINNDLSIINSSDEKNIEKEVKIIEASEVSTDTLDEDGDE